MSIKISLDIESTGFDTKIDQILEIAAVKFDGETIIDQFTTLLNPGIKIPKIITHITGIEEKDVVNAPTLEQIKPELEAFLGNFPIVGHNIDFDVNFLKAKGVNIQSASYDTLQLSTTLLPGLPSYSLDTLVRLLKIEHKNEHRALTDTLACWKLFLILEQELANLDEEIYVKINKLLEQNSWQLKNLFLETKNLASKSKASPTEKASTPSALPQQISTIHELFEQGTISQAIQHYELRPEQKNICETIADSMSNNYPLLIETGTGNGKTFAYLSAALLTTLKEASTKNKTFIALYSDQVEEQIEQKEMPILEKLLNIHQEKIIFIKHRKQYLSSKRLENAINKEALEDYEVGFYIKALIWAHKTHTGELKEMALIGKEPQLLDTINCDEYVCPHEIGFDNQAANEGCFFMKIMAKAQQAQLLVGHQSLIFENATGETPFLPEFSHLIIDEAHQFEKIATENFSRHLSFFRFIRPYENVKKQLIDEQKDLAQALEQLSSKVHIFFGLIGIYLEKHLPPRAEYSEISLKESDLANKEWQQVEQAHQNLKESGNQFYEILEKTIESESPNKHELKNLGNGIKKDLKVLSDILEAELKSHNYITAVYKTNQDNIGIKQTPIHLGEMLQEKIYKRHPNTIILGTALRSDDSFNYIRAQLGLGQEFQEKAFPSHFSYPEQVKIIIPQDLAEPNSEGNFRQSCEIIQQVVRANKGRTIVLFTSKKGLFAAYNEIGPILKKEGINVLAYQVSGGRGKILEQLKSDPEHSMIFANLPFWESLDLESQLINCIVLQKLPFDLPTDPLIAARSKQFADSFNQYQLPRAILRFKQSFGKIIRHENDKGTIILLDSRIVQKDYGQKFLKSLPEGIKTIFATKEKIGESI